MRKLLLTLCVLFACGTVSFAQRMRFDYLRAAYFGFSNLTNVNYYGNWKESQSPEFLDQDMGKSFGFALDVCNFRFFLDRKADFDVQLALRFAFEDHVFSNPDNTLVMANGKLWPVPIEGGAQKSKMHMGYVGVPLDFSWHRGKFRVFAGISAEILLDSYVKYKYPETRYNIQGVNIFRSNVEAGIIFHHIGIYANYCITPLFKEGTGSDAGTFSVGLMLGM